MPPERLIFRLLAEEQDPSADDALCLALYHADQVTARAIVETLLMRNRPRGFTGLVQAFHCLDDSNQQFVLTEVDRLYGGLRTAFQTRDEQVRINVMEVIRQGRAFRASYLLDPGLRDSSSRVRDAAAAALHALAEDLLQDPLGMDENVLQEQFSSIGVDEVMRDLDVRAEDRAQVVSAIEAGLACYNIHLQPRVVEAALWFVDGLGSRFWSIIASPGSRVARTAISIFNRSFGPRLVPFAIMAIRHREFRSHIVQAISQYSDVEFLRYWLAQSWRLAQPKVIRGFSSVKEIQCLDEQLRCLLENPDDCQPQLVRWIFSLGLPEELKVNLLRELQRRGNPATRRSATWTLTRLQDRQATSLLQFIAHDDDDQLSRMACFELARRRPMEYPPVELLARLRKSSPKQKQGKTTKDEPITFERYWSVFDLLGEQERKEQGRKLLTTNPSVPAMLKRRLIEADPSSRIKVIQMVCVLGLADKFAEDLYRLGHDPQPEIRSAVMSALGRIPSPTSQHILQNALRDENKRVQANAIEALENAPSLELVDELLPKLASEDNRVRTNAVKALLKMGVRQAAETLLKMLTCQSRAQKISALWLIERMGLASVATKVISLADPAREEDAEVRERACRMLDQRNENTPQPKTINQQQEVSPSSV